MALLPGPGAYVVPNFAIGGQQNKRRPFQDKAYLLEKEVRHPTWLAAPPTIKSRSELQQARKQGRLPDPTYDFDGDGAIGQLDYFVGRSFDRDVDGHLTARERAQAEQALKGGFLDRFVRGLEATGPVHRNGVVQQRRGVIIDVVDPANASVLTYGPHFNSHHCPPHSTLTELRISRMAQARNEGAVVCERAVALCAPVLEPQPPSAATHPGACAIAHVRERAEADHEASRVRAGLLPMNQPVNPEREFKTVGLGRVEQPLYNTRGQLLETRKEANKRQCEDLRVKADEVCVPLSVRRSEKEAKLFEFRRLRDEPMTQTRLQDARKRAKVEYDMANFTLPHAWPRDYPKFSDRPDVPFWINGPATAGASSRTPRVIPRTFSEPVLKVTDVPWGEEMKLTRDALPDTAYHTAAGLAAPTSGNNSHYGSYTVKRWTTDMLDRGQARNKPRLFDDIQPARVGPRDMEALDITSAMECIRNDALRLRLVERKKNAENPRRSRLWNTSQQADSANNLSVTVPTVSQTLDSTSLVSMAHSLDRTRTIHRSRVASDPHLRTAALIQLDRTEKPREPRSFSSVTMSAPQASGVRHGGFQMMDGPAAPPPPSPVNQRHAMRRGVSPFQRDRTASNQKEEVSASL